DSAGLVVACLVHDGADAGEILSLPDPRPQVHSRAARRSDRGLSARRWAGQVDSGPNRRRSPRTDRNHEGIAGRGEAHHHPPGLVDSGGGAGADRGGEDVSNGEPLIQIDHVVKVYHRDALEIPGLNDINLKVPAGEYVALMGPSGSGKTTLLNLIAGIDQPTRGRIVIGGRDISQISQTELARWRSRTIGFIFQLYNLLPVLTAYENVELPLLLTNLSKKERRRAVETALPVVGLSDRMDHYPRQLSGGQEQRVAIARAIVSDPSILVADEPTGDLDAKSADEILELLKRLNEEFHKTIIMVTHDPKAASRAHRMVHLDKGVLHSEELTGTGTLKTV